MQKKIKSVSSTDPYVALDKDDNFVCDMEAILRGGMLVDPKCDAVQHALHTPMGVQSAMELFTKERESDIEMNYCAELGAWWLTGPTIERLRKGRPAPGNAADAMRQGITQDIASLVALQEIKRDAGANVPLLFIHKK